MGNMLAQITWPQIPAALLLPISSLRPIVAVILDRLFGVTTEAGDHSGEGVLVEDAPIGIRPCNLDFSSLANTPIKFDVLKQKLQLYDCPDREYLIDGFSKGFPLHYDGPRLATESKNLKSALKLSSIVEHKINKEILAGRVAGPI